MSIQIALEDLAACAAEYGEAAYVLAATASGPPRVTHSPVQFEDGELRVTVGRRAAAAFATNPGVCVLWPATADQPMSLIVDGEVEGEIDPEGGMIRIRPVGAVRHRSASG